MTTTQQLAFETGNGPAVSGCGIAGTPNNETDGPAVPGCTDSTATNYDPQATVDDGSCQHAAPACDPLRIAFEWTQYGAGFGALDISQYSLNDPIVSSRWDYGQTPNNPDGFSVTGPSVQYFYDEAGTWPLSLTIYTLSGEVRTISTTTPIVLPWDNTTAPVNRVFSTTPVAGLSFCEPPPS